MWGNWNLSDIISSASKLGTQTTKALYNAPKYMKAVSEYYGGEKDKGLIGPPDNTGEDVAIKQMKKGRLSATDLEELFKREVGCLMKLTEVCDTLNIICLEDAFVYNDDYYIVTKLFKEYITLEEFIKNDKYVINSNIADKIISIIDNQYKILTKNLKITQGDWKYYDSSGRRNEK
jgi:hypothetical protein